MSPVTYIESSLGNLLLLARLNMNDNGNKTSFIANMITRPLSKDRQEKW